MRKLKTKSILACAVLASVLAGGMSSVRAEQVNAFVMPKDFNSSLYGKEITFGQRRGFSSNQFQTFDPQKVQIIEERPTWQIVAVDNGSLTLLANHSWGINRISDVNHFNMRFNSGATVQQYHYREVLQCLEERKNVFFSNEELSFLAQQKVVEEWKRDSDAWGVSEYESIFSLPTKQMVENLTPQQRKRNEIYWLNDAFFRTSSNDPMIHDIYYSVCTVEADGSLTEHEGSDAYNFYPTIKIQPVFAYYGTKEIGNSFQMKKADSGDAVHFAVRNTLTENNVRVEALEITRDTIKFTADGLATGTGQGLGGILADNNGNYVSYIRLANTTSSGKVQDVVITAGNNKFLNDEFTPGKYTVYLFNEKLNTDSCFDYVGNFEKLAELSMGSSESKGKITSTTLSGNHTFKNLTVSGGASFSFEAVNYAGGNRHGSWWDRMCESVTVTDSLNWENVLTAEGSITLKGSFYVSGASDRETLILERPTNIPEKTDSCLCAIEWNDMIYNGNVSQSATLKVNGEMHGLTVNGGTFTAENSLTLDDCLRINNGATVNVYGFLTSPNCEINGTLHVDEYTDFAGFWHVYKDRKIEGGVNVKGTLKLEQNAVIDGDCNVFSNGKLDVVDNCTITKLYFFDNSTLQVDGNKIQNHAAVTYTDWIGADDNSKLIIKNQKEGVEYKIVEKEQPLMLMANGFGNSNSTQDLEEIVWPEYGLVVDLNNSKFGDSWSVVFQKDPELPEYSDIPNIVSELINQKESIPWIEELTNEFQACPDKELYLETLNNSANTIANLNSLANVQGGLRTMSSLVTDSIQENAGFRSKGQGARENVWASYIHSKEKIEGRKTGHLQQNSSLQYNGVVVGADLWKSEHGFGGVALSYADGSFHSFQMVTGVRNEADYYGISVYNRQDVGKFSFIYNGGFTYGKNDATLINYWDENITAKPKAMAYNMGFKMEEPIKLSKATELRPFAGLRYTFIKTKDYTDNCADGYSADNQHLVNLPIGLTLKGTYETKGGWNLGGALTGGYNWNLGNRTGTQSIEYGGFSDSMNFDMADRGEYFVKAGLMAEHKNLAFELGYRYSKGDTSRDNRWNVNMNLIF